MSEETDSRLPLRSWTLKNFKSVRKARIDFRPLTLLVGVNSSGKSTVLQSILLVAQSVQSGATTGAFGLNGQLVNLGIYDDVRTAHSRGGIHLGGLLELPISRLPSGAARGDVARVKWDAKLALAGKKESGAVLVHSVAVDAMTSSAQGEQRYALRLSKSAQDTVGVASWPEDLWDLDTFGADIRVLHGYEGTVGPARPQSRDERLGGAKYSGVFPVDVAAVGPAIQSAVRQWIKYATSAETYFSHFEDGEWLDGAPWSPSDLSGELEDVVACLTESLEKQRSAAGDDPDWPRRWVDSLSRTGNVVRECQGWTDVDDPTLRLLFALSAPQNAARLEREAASGEPLLNSAGKPATRWHYEPQNSVEREWLDLGTSLSRVLTQSEDEICAGVAAQFPDAGQMCLDAGPDAAYLMRCSSSLADFFARNVFYLGPLREDPHPVSNRSLVPNSSALGTKGEYMTAVLLDHEDDSISAPRPRDGELGCREVTLREAVKEWLRFFEIAIDIHLEETRPGPVLQIQAREGGKWLHLTHVGVGVSQLLPVIVLCLLAPEGSVVMLEQPELHLHPALQQRLGDFLLACANSGRQLIVETHSEYIVSRLRRRIAAAPDDSLVSTVEILFAENERGDTHFRLVRANEYGGIEVWPEGFFDQSASEAQEILRAAIKKRKAVANKTVESSKGRSDT
jgi:predicted ATPase